ALLALLRILETQLAVVEDAADRRPLIRRHLDQVEVGLPGTLQGLCGRHDVQLFPIGANQAYGGDANLLVDSWPTVRRRLTIEMTNTWSPSSGQRNVVVRLPGSALRLAEGPARPAPCPGVGRRLALPCFSLCPRVARRGDRMRAASWVHYIPRLGRLLA